MGATVREYRIHALDVRPSRAGSKWGPQRCLARIGNGPGFRSSITNHPSQIRRHPGTMASKSAVTRAASTAAVYVHMIDRSRATHSGNGPQGSSGRRAAAVLKIRGRHARELDPRAALLHADAHARCPGLDLNAEVREVRA